MESLSGQLGPVGAALLGAAIAGLYELLSFARSTRAFLRKNLLWFFKQRPAWLYFLIHAMLAFLFDARGLELVVRSLGRFLYGEISDLQPTILDDPIRRTIVSTTIYLGGVGGCLALLRVEPQSDPYLGINRPEIVRPGAIVSVVVCTVLCSSYLTSLLPPVPWRHGGERDQPRHARRPRLDDREEHRAQGRHRPPREPPRENGRAARSDRGDPPAHRNGCRRQPRFRPPPRIARGQGAMSTARAQREAAEAYRKARRKATRAAEDPHPRACHACGAAARGRFCTGARNGRGLW